MTALAIADIAARVAAAVPGVELRESDNKQPWLLVPADGLVAACTLLRDDPALACAALMDLTGCDLLKYPGNAPPAAPAAKAPAAAAPAAAAPAAPAAAAAAAAPASDAIAVVYLLRSLKHRHVVTLKVLAPRAACAVPSVAAVWPAAIYFEREVFDLLGVTFTGHPDLRRIMCPDDWVGHPLRKDYVYPAAYNGVPHARDGQRFEGPPARSGAGG